jgi:small subunit ribosomal protein S6
MVRQYEIVYIFDSALEEAQINERLDRFHELLKSPDIAQPVTNTNHWGKRTLAYPIKSREQGSFVVVHFETSPELLNEFERVLKLDEAVLRYLVVINEGFTPEPAPEAASASPTAAAPTAAAPDDDAVKAPAKAEEV